MSRLQFTRGQIAMAKGVLNRDNHGRTGAVEFRLILVPLSHETVDCADHAASTLLDKGGRPPGDWVRAGAFLCT